jgi:glycosyltransferase involved in cell wall biosynthesis
MKNYREGFSIIMPAYNAEQTIENSIKSVQAQTEKDWELLIVDDHSVDRTSEIARAFQEQDCRIKLIRHRENKGVAAARNTALGSAKRKFIAFLDSDDSWTEYKLEYQQHLLDQGAKVVFGSYRRVYKNKTYQVVSAKKTINAKIFQYYNPIGNLTGAYDRTIGMVLQKNVRHEDYVMWYEIVKRAGKGYGISTILGDYTINTDSLSGDKVKAARWHWEAIRKEMNLSRARASVAFIGYVAYSSMIRSKPRRPIAEA